MKVHSFSFLMSVMMGFLCLAQEWPGRTIAVVNGVEARSFDDAHGAAVVTFVAEHGREPAGEADEQAIRAKVRRQQCETLRSEVQRILEEQERQRLGIKAGTEDLEAARKLMQRQTDPERTAAESQAQGKAILEALTEVHERGADPERVFEQRLSGLRLTVGGWRAIVRHSHNSDWRTTYGRMARLTAQDVARSIAKTDIRPVAERRLFDAAIDDEIASRDSNFKEYLADERRQRKEAEVKGGSISVPLFHFEYLQQKRKEHWDQVHSRASVVVLDPELADSCTVYDHRPLPTFSGPAPRR